MPNWSKRYIASAEHYATSSKDSTQVGVVFYNPKTHSVLLNGYNGFPRGVNDDVPEHHERPLKYKYTVHAETSPIDRSSAISVILSSCVFECK